MVATNNNMSNSGIASREQVKEAYDEKKVTVNKNVYEFGSMTHKERRSVFAFMTSITSDIQTGNFMFFDSKAFEKVERIIEESTTFEGIQISKSPEHWEKNLADYFKFMIAAMGIISYPFMAG